ncbi:hypothetical protein KIN20_019262 [Parelaphostrongylus tenuis]|uniref:Uncharacterized protein n=1 Tax=Parelaphostrongylus tenuis TaxID=148309 RepID=A0AAD5QUZ0_PARTN|nr:hypothetical protein KIN20_019262 [Parelaphostrongylus tenuis]
MLLSRIVPNKGRQTVQSLVGVDPVSDRPSALPNSPYRWLWFTHRHLKQLRSLEFREEQCSQRFGMRGIMQTTSNIIMANWSKEIWQSVMNRVARALASGPLESHFHWH